TFVIGMRYFSRTRPAWPCALDLDRLQDRAKHIKAFFERGLAGLPALHKPCVDAAPRAAHCAFERGRLRDPAPQEPVRAERRERVGRREETARDALVHHTVLIR